ncbi:uncharacterized protein LOC143193553 [Rhynchophorus ferrugineus]|uniref:Uncharacterized protein n=1 Tax=Rhynchophorus ferrugineus TaxID=354439 RepID=A0A834IRB9_RHYFE|nr:hypothetical protein GWI33_021459 [Rhynchophorus ferrugineus]
MLKLYLFTIVCILLVQKNAADDTELTASKDEAKKAFHHLMEAIDKALTEAQTALNKAMDKVHEKATELEGKANVEIDKVLSPLRKKLDDLVSKAKQKGFDVTKCQSYVNHFSNTPDQLAHDLIECINSQVQKAQDNINDALNNAKKIEEDMNSIDAEIDNCGGNKWKKIKCYAKIIEKIAKDTKDAPEKIMADVTNTTLLVANIIPILEDCFTKKIKEAGDNALKDVKDFAVCVAIPF